MATAWLGVKVVDLTAGMVMGCGAFMASLWMENGAISYFLLMPCIILKQKPNRILNV